MAPLPSDVAFTPAVKEMQSQKGSRDVYARVEYGEGWPSGVTSDLAEFLAEIDTFFLGTASAEGQPYIQHRGGPPGFLKVIDDTRLGFADFGGNRQYITLGNLSENPKAFIFLMDFAKRRRVKLWGEARVVEDDPELLERLRDRNYPGRVERAILFRIATWDVNCPQHIQPRFTRTQIAPALQELQAKITDLEAQLAELRGK